MSTTQTYTLPSVAICCAIRLIYYMAPDEPISSPISVQKRDAELFHRIRNNDADALGELMDLHTPRLLSIAEITVGTSDLAREAVQDAFFELWEKRHILNPDTKPISYLIVATRHRALDLIRNERMHGRTETVLTRVYVDDNARSYNAGEIAAEEEEAKAVLQKALSEVQPRAREIFLLHHEAGLSYEEIEKLLGISNGTVRLQMSKASTHIAKALKRWMFGK